GPRSVHDCLDLVAVLDDLRRILNDDIPAGVLDLLTSGLLVPPVRFLVEAPQSGEARIIRVAVAPAPDEGPIASVRRVRGLKPEVWRARVPGLAGPRVLLRAPELRVAVVQRVVAVVVPSLRPHGLLPGDLPAAVQGRRNGQTVARVAARREG